MKIGAAKTSGSLGNERWIRRDCLPEKFSAPREALMLRISSSLAARRTSQSGGQFWLSASWKLPSARRVRMPPKESLSACGASCSSAR